MTRRFLRAMCFWRGTGRVNALVPAHIPLDETLFRRAEILGPSWRSAALILARYIVEPTCPGGNCELPSESLSTTRDCCGLFVIHGFLISTVLGPLIH